MSEVLSEVPKAPTFDPSSLDPEYLNKLYWRAENEPGTLSLDELRLLDALTEIEDAAA